MIRRLISAPPQQTLVGGVEEGEPPPLEGGDGFGQSFERADLDFEVLFVCAGMIGFGAEEFGAGGELVAEDGRGVVDGPLLLAELRCLIERNPIHAHCLGRFFVGDAIPAQHASNLQVTRRGQDGDEDKVSLVHIKKGAR